MRLFLCRYIHMNMGMAMTVTLQRCTSMHAKSQDSQALMCLLFVWGGTAPSLQGRLETVHLSPGAA